MSAAGMHCQLLLNGYNSNSQSPSDGGLMAKSPGSLNQDPDGDEDDMAEPQSPNPAPLSLTTNHSPSHTPSSPQENASSNVERIKEENGESEEPNPPETITDSQNNNNPKEEQPEISEDEEEEMEMSESEESKEEVKVKVEGSSTGEGPRPGFPLVPNSMFSHSIMYMSHYFPGLNPPHPGQQGLNLSSALADERRKRNRTFIDPVSEVPRLEQWFSVNTHPSHNLILKYTDDLNRMPYRQKFPPLEPKNVQFWFKNRRAKCKRLKMSLFDSQPNYHMPTPLSTEHYQGH